MWGLSRNYKARGAEQYPWFTRSLASMCTHCVLRLSAGEGGVILGDQSITIGQE